MSKKWTKINIPQFLRFCNQSFRLSDRARSLRDGRKAPRRKPQTIFFSVFLMGATAMKSILQLDQNLRMDGVPSGLKVSDSTIQRVLKIFDIAPLRKLLHSSFLISRQMGHSSLKLGNRKLRVGLIDGSSFGKFLASAFQVIGQVNLMVDIKRIEKLGKELPTSREIIKELVEEFGKRFVDLILLDGLYADKNTINLCKKESNIDVLIKTEEETLDIIDHAKRIFSNEKMRAEIEYEEGFDPERWCKYKVFAVEGLHFEGVEFPMKVAMVEEYYPKRKRNKEVKFFVITTFEELSAMEMRELGHLRWRIENNGFRALNDQTNCKHVYTHDENAFDALMMILFTAWNLLNAYVESLDKEELRKVFGKVKFTLRFFSSLLLRSFGSEVIPEVT